MGGRIHPFPNCFCQVPVKVGDAVVIEAPFGDSAFQGCFVVGLQVPRRPLMYQSPTFASSRQVSPTVSRLHLSVPYEYLGWPQAFAFDFDGTMALDWVGRANWDDEKPSTAYVFVTTRIQKLENGAWTDVWAMPVRRLDGVVSTGPRLYGRVMWMEVIDDGDTLLPDALAGGEAYRMVFDIEGGGVRWYSTDINDWATTAFSDLNVNLYTLAVVELGGGTY